MGEIILPSPAGFNLAALAAPEAREYGVLLVEGPLDAIACTERGRPAVAMLRTFPDGRLVAALKRRPELRIYLALDGTEDVDQGKRCRIAARIGRLCRICVLPPGKDPDDLSAEEIDSLKREARLTLDEWLTWVEMLAGKPEEQRRARDELAAHARAWVAEDVEVVGEVRARICAAWNLEDEEFSAWLKPAAPRAGKMPAARAAGVSPANRPEAGETKEEIGRPRTPGAEARGSGERKILTNVAFETETNEKGEEKKKKSARPLDEIRMDLLAALNHSLHRLRSPGAKEPFLFLPRAEGGVRWCTCVGALKALAAEYAELRFADKVDGQGRNFLGFGDLYQSLGGTARVKEFESLELYPHEPPWKESFYCWTHPEKYDGDGRTLAAIVGLFDNIKLPAHRALFAAALITPFWGGPPGRRPAFVFTADDVGCGKGAAAGMIGAGCGGALEFELSARGEERLKTRLLSPEGLVKRIVMLDNAKGVIDSPLLESLITSPRLSGHRLNVGEASRPNSLCVLITVNDARLSPDMARRVFFIQLAKPVYSREWEDLYCAIRASAEEHLAADALRLLRAPAPRAEAGNDSLAPWIQDVLARVLTSPILRDTIGDVTLEEILAQNAALRGETDESRALAESITAALVAYLAGQHGMVSMPVVGGAWKGTPPASPVFFSAHELADVWKRAMGRKEINVPWASRSLASLIRSGRVQGISIKRTACARGFEAAPEIFVEYLKAVETGEVRLPEETARPTERGVR